MNKTVTPDLVSRASVEAMLNKHVENGFKGFRLLVEDLSQLPSVSAPGGEFFFDAMRRAHALCPTGRPHLDRMRWMGEYVRNAVISDTPPGETS